MDTLRKLPSRILLALVSLSLPVGAASEPVEFRAYVQSKYRLKDDLEAWHNTARLIAAVVETNFDHQGKPLLLVNQPPGDLNRLLKTPGGNPAAFKILYIGSHVRADGKMLFADGTKEFPSVITRTAGDAGQFWQPDLIIVDTCHAASFAYDREWVERFPAHYLFASDTVQLAWEIDFRHRKPVLFMERYPNAYRYVGSGLGDSWDGTLSDLGFRLGKLLAPEQEEGKRSFSSALALFEALGEMPKEKNISFRRFRQSSLIWRSPEEVRKIALKN